MKTAHIGIIAVFVLLLTACNSKSDNTSATLNDNDYFQVEIGKNENGRFTITQLEPIKQDWESRLNNNGNRLTLTEFKIVKAYTTDESPVEYYLLIANSKDGRLRTASLLNLKGNSFFIDTRKDNGALSYSNIVCEGNCNEGCLPVVSIHNGTRYLNCSQCVECVKKETEIR